ncbi:unnamed protein product [Lepeophtheirus salmonis]|uniref:(salmon louse) hypothetical protein n=1 Tax=Lepeophtheirus salmonis TaxID=72036 RepID=A0A7R8D0G5_LEPSM|nr:unnamed protein product [Lepeophtheirus salmonis]CAF2984257.1 unnamed protein product [Lepeophtheirus salmonis]
MDPQSQQTSYIVREPTKYTTETLSSGNIIVQSNSQNSSTVKRISSEILLNINNPANSIGAITEGMDGHALETMQQSGSSVINGKAIQCIDHITERNVSNKNDHVSSSGGNVSERTKTLVTSHSSTSSRIPQASPSSSTTNNKSVATTTTALTRVHSDGHRVRSDTFTYTKKPVIKTTKTTVTKRVKA